MATSAFEQEASISSCNNYPYLFESVEAYCIGLVYIDSKAPKSSWSCPHKPKTKPQGLACEVRGESEPKMGG
jgi:hypothetical protein